MKKLVSAGIKALPPQARKRIELLVTPITGLLARRGVQASAEAKNWVSTHRRSVSIVIPSYNDFELIRTCIKSIRKTCSSFDYEIIVVDDYCQPENNFKLETLKSKDCKVIFKKERGGFAITVNVGMAAATKEDIVLLNSDTVALPGWLEELQFAAHGIDPEIGLVSPKLLYPSGRIQYGGTFHARDIAPQWFAHLHAGRWTTHPDGNVPGYIFGISGACMYTTRFTYEQLGGLDETYWLGFEDVDYAMSAWTNGIRCYYQPQAVLFHHESASRGYSQGKRELGSLRYFWRKWASLFEAKSSVMPKPALEFVMDQTNLSDGWRNHIQALTEIAEKEGYFTTFLNIGTIFEPPTTPKGIITIACDAQSSDKVWLKSINSNPAIRLISETSLLEASKEPAKKALLKPEFYFVTATAPQASLLNQITPWKSMAVIKPISSISTSKPTSGSPEKIIVLTSGEQHEPLQTLEGSSFEVREVQTISNDLCSEIAAGGYGIIVNLRDGLTAEEFNQLSTLGAALITVRSDGLELIALDGYNCLLIDHNFETLYERVNDLSGDSTVIEEFATNAWASYETLVHQSRMSFISVLSSLTRVD